MDRDLRFLESIRLDRRGLFVLAAAALTSACGGNGGGSASTATTATETTTGTTGATEASSAVTVTGVPARVRPLDDAALTGFQRTFAADWLGAWTDDAGGAGTFDATLGIDVPKRLAEIGVTFAGPVLGEGPPVSARHTIDVEEAHGRELYRLRSSQIGEFEARPLGNYATDFTLVNIPGYPGVAKVEGSLSGNAGQGYLTVLDRTGSVRTVSFAFAQGARPQPPDAGEIVRLHITTGAFACRFLTEQEATRLVGEQVVVFRNGGALNYEPGVDISNCWYVRPRDVVSSGVVKGAVLDYSVFRAVNPARAKAYFETARSRAGSAVVATSPGLGDDSFQVGSFEPGAAVEVWVRVKSHLLKVTLPFALWKAPAARRRAAVLGVAEAVVPRLRSI
jgi:hypothetical protein